MAANNADVSLSEVNQTVNPDAQRKGWRRIAAFFGPAFLVSVGYMDPGNWATDLAGGAQFGYALIWVLVMSNIMALLLQSLSARLGIVRRRDLAQCNREVYPRRLNFILYLLAELAIAATDLAEVLGMAVGLNLLLKIPLMWGVIISLLDTFLLLYLQRLGMRKMEAFIVALVGIIGLSFLAEMILAKPSLMAIAGGLKPSIPNETALYIAIGIIGATVMPHNLYLHSALVQTRKVGRDEASIRRAIKWNTVDSAVALNLALFVNAAILILAAAVFHTRGMGHVAELKDAHMLLSGLLNTEWASRLFAIALIAAGQSSTVTGTLAGQIVMEGYLHLRINPWMRRLITRLLAVVPAVLVIMILGDDMVDEMLIFSQVLLSMQLAFAVIPLIHFVSSRQGMGRFAIGTGTAALAWLVAVVLVALNAKLLYDLGGKSFAESDSLLIKGGLIAGALAFLALLAVTVLYPILRRKPEAIPSAGQDIHGKPVVAQAPWQAAPVAPFATVAVALDFSGKDASVLAYARKLAEPGATLVLLHIVESASAKRAGADTDDGETSADQARLQAIADALAADGFTTKVVLGFRDRAREIARIANEHHTDLLILGSHGHSGLKDYLYGETINAVRHLVKAPVFIAR